MGPKKRGEGAPSDVAGPREEAGAPLKGTKRVRLDDGELPPATIDFFTGLPAEPPGNWFTPDTANKAAEGTRSLARLLGHVKISVSVPGQPDRLEKCLQQLGEPVAVKTQRTQRKQGAKYIAWNENGEFATDRGEVSVYRLHQLVEENTLSVFDKDRELLTGLVGWCNPELSPWTQPMLRVVGWIPEAKSYGVVNVNGSQVLQATFTLWVYANRLLFELIADPGIKSLMENIVPVRPVPRLTTLPRYPAMFTSHCDRAGDPNYHYTIQGLLKWVESEGYPMAQQPEGFVPSLHMYEFQLNTLQWMLDREHGPSINDYFWVPIEWADGDSYYYFPLAGELRLQKPPHRTGGILAEEMGLGKTVETLALILAHPRPGREPGTRDESSDSEDEVTYHSQLLNARWTRQGYSMQRRKNEGKKKKKNKKRKKEESEEEGEDGRIKTGATLIVVPLTLLGQWVDELERNVEKGKLEVVCVANGDEISRRVSPRHLGLMIEEEEELVKGYKVRGRALGSTHKLDGKVMKVYHDGYVDVKWEITAEWLSKHDVVLTSYNCLKQQMKYLFDPVDWWRIVLDECQELKVSTTQIAATCRRLCAANRWMVSGTPLTSSINDLHGELQFLQVWPFSLTNDGFWESKVFEPWAKHDALALNLLHSLIGVLMIRHSKSQTYADGSGRPLMSLPQRTVEWKPIRMHTDSTAYVYGFMDHYASAEVNKWAVEGTEDPEDQGSNSNANVRQQRARLSKLKQLLFQLQLVATHPSILSLSKYDTLRRALQAPMEKKGEQGIREMDGMSVLAVVRAATVSRMGGMNRDVKRTWAIQTTQDEEAQQRYAGMGLKELRAEVLKRGLEDSQQDRHNAVCLVRYQKVVTGKQQVTRNLPLRDIHTSTEGLEGPQGGSVVYVWEGEKHVTAHWTTGSCVGEVIVRTEESLDVRFTTNFRVQKGKEAAGEGDGEEGVDGPMPKVVVGGVLEGGLVSLHTSHDLSGQIQPTQSVRIGTVKEGAEDGGRVATVVYVSPFHLVCSLAKQEEGEGTMEAAAEGWAEGVGIGETDIYRKSCTCRKEPLVRELVRADQLQRGQHGSDIHEAGFGALVQVIEGHPVDCAICMSEAERPTVTLCVHVYCRQCVLALLKHKSDLAQQAQCPVCRKRIRLDELMEVVQSEKKEEATSVDESFVDANGESGLNAGGNGGEAFGSGSRIGSTHFVPAYDPAQYQNIPLPPLAPPPNLDYNYPSLPGLFLSHHTVASSQPSPKLSALLVDMQTMLKKDASSKFVVFSQFPSALRQAESVLSGAGLQCVLIAGNIDRTVRQNAVTAFQHDEKTKVILLSVGAAAAGLTLTAANVVYMLEPCYRSADQAQALNRAHRIGQTRPVRCVIYYTLETVEERVVGLRVLQGDTGGSESTDELSIGGGDLEGDSALTFTRQQMLYLTGLADSL